MKRRFAFASSTICLYTFTAASRSPAVSCWKTPFSNCAAGVSARTCPELIEGAAEKFTAAASHTIATHRARIACSFPEKPGHPIRDRV